MFSKTSTTIFTICAILYLSSANSSTCNYYQCETVVWLKPHSTPDDKILTGPKFETIYRWQSNCWSNGEHLFSLTHYQTTKFRLFQTKRVCRWQFQISRKWQKVIQTNWRHCGKRRNCSLRAISPCSHSVFKRLVSQGRQKVSLCGNGLIG